MALAMDDARQPGDWMTASATEEGGCYAADASAGAVAHDRAAPVASVLIPHKDDLDRLKLCLASVEASIRACGRPVEVIVCDNGSEADLSSIIAAFPGVRFVVEPEGHSGAARNKAWEASRAPILISTDSDCIAAEGFVGAAIAAAERGEADSIGGRIALLDETPPPRSGSEALETAIAFQQARYIARGKFTVTANLVTTRAVWDEVGPFPADRPDDKDWCTRAHALGFTLAYDPRIVVSHPTRGTLAALRRKSRRIIMKEMKRKPDGLRERLRRGVFALRIWWIFWRDLRLVLGSREITAAEKRRAVGALCAVSVSRSGYWLRAMAGREPRP